MCLTASYLATGGLSFNYFKMHVWSTKGLHLLSFFSQIHVVLKINAILASQKYSFICISGLSKRYSCFLNGM